VESGLQDDNFNKKPNSAKKRPDKGQTDWKARKKSNFVCGIALPFSQKTSKLKDLIRNFIRN